MGSFDISYFTSEFCKFVVVNRLVFCKFDHFHNARPYHFSYDRKKTIPPMYSSAPGKSSLTFFDINSFSITDAELKSAEAGIIPTVT